MVNRLPPHIKTKRAGYHAVIISGVLLFSSQKSQAVALFDHIIQPYVGTQLMYDSNLLRLPKNFTPSLSGNKTDSSSFIKQAKAGVALKWQFSQQQITADVSVDQNWYSNYSELDYTGHNLLGRWDWLFGKRFKGIISYSNRLALGNLGQLNRLVLKNFENRELYLANGNYEIIQDWYLRAQLSHSSLRYKSLERQASDLNEISQEYGLRYLNELETMVGIRAIIVDGRYTNRNETSPLDNAYVRTTYGLEGKWNYSVKTRFSGEVGYTSQEFAHLKNRNFSDIIARADMLWEPTAKTSFFLEVWRDIYSADSLTASFMLSQGIELTPKWTWSQTPKIQLELPMSYQQQNAVGNIGLSDNTTIPTQSNLSNIRINLNYTPISNIEMSAFAGYEKRSANSSLRSYQDQSIGLTMKISF